MHQMWQDMFNLGGPLMVLEKVLRPMIVYFFLLIGLRLGGSGSWHSSTRSTSSC